MNKIIRIKENEFSSTLFQTIGIDKVEATITINDSQGNLKDIKLKMHDAGGIMNIRTIEETIFTEADALVLVYDVTNHLSFLELKDILEGIVKNPLFKKNQLCIVCNKIDLVSNYQPSQEEAQELAVQHNFQEHVYVVSAKDNTGIDNFITNFSQAIHDYRMKNKLYESVKLRQQKKARESSKCKC